MNHLDLVATITSLNPVCFRKNDIYMRMHAWGPSRINRQNISVIDHMSVLLYGCAWTEDRKRTLGNVLGQSSILNDV